MNVGATITLNDGTSRDLEFGDVLKFHFEPLMDSPFSNSYFGRSIVEQKPDEIIFHIGKGEFDLFRAEVDYIKNGEKFDSFSFIEPRFFDYVCSKKSFSFLKNSPKAYEKEIDFPICFGDIFIVNFNDFEKANFLKKEYLDILKEKQPTHIAIHFFNVKEAMPNYINSLEAKFYAFNEHGFQHLETEEELNENIDYYEKKGIKYMPDEHIIDFSFNGIKNHELRFFKKQGFLEYKATNILGATLSFEALKNELELKNSHNNLLKSAKKMKL